jgi:hypothetical protein
MPRRIRSRCIWRWSAPRSRPASACLIQAGWFANDFIEAAFRDGARDFCPSVTAHFLDARTPEVRFPIWQAGDIFTSLSDNIQETFGLTPIEAMAAGLPSVVTDWDGYKDTVQHGEHGMRVPTFSPPPGQGADLADAHGAGIDTYDRYYGYASQFVAVDINATVDAYVSLIGNAGPRASTATPRARRFSDVRLAPCHRALPGAWAELAERRRGRRVSASQRPALLAGARRSVRCAVRRLSDRVGVAAAPA